MQTLRKKNSPCKFKKEPTRFLGEGVSFKAKLIGILEVSEARGDRMCQAALADLKMAIRAAGEHKQRIAVQVSIDGLRLRDEKTGECLYHHPVHKISFIAQDMSDSRAFGYIFGSPDTGHRFFGIKTDKAANQVVIAMRDLFQVVFELKKKEIELTKQNIEQSAKFHISGIFVEPAPDTKGAAGTESCLQRIRTASLDAEKISSNSASNEKKNETQTGVIADLLDLQFELNSLQQGIHQLDKITPDNPRPSSEDPFESDPFGDSFANMKVTSSVQPILPPPPSSSKRAHLERQPTIPATSSLTSSPATHTSLSSKTPPPQETVKWMENDSEKRFSDGEIASLTNNNGSADEDRENGSIGIGSSQRRSPQIDVFTELDPLGTGLSKPYIDKKDFFQHLKNPPKKVLKDLVTTNSGETFPTNFDITLDPLDPIRVRNDVGRKSTESFEDGDFANFESFDTENERLPEATAMSSPQPHIVAEKSDSPQQLSGRSSQRTIHHQPLSVSLPPEESPVHHKSCSLSNSGATISGSSAASVISRMEKESGDLIQTLMLLPSPKKYQSMKRREHEMEMAGSGRRRESIDKSFPVDFSKSTESCSSEANSRLSSSSAELDIVPEPPPRGTAGILINPPPLPPKKQAVRGGSSKPPPRPPYTDSQLHYDFIEREETSPSPTRRDHTQSPGQMESIKSRFDDNFSPSPSRIADAQRGEDNVSFSAGSASAASRYEAMIPTTLSTLFRNPYISNVSGDTKRVLNTAPTSTSFTTTTAKPSLDITLSQLTSSNLAEFATSLDMSVTELTNLTLQQLTECLARLSTREANGPSTCQRHSASPAATSAKIVETSFVSSEPLFKADFDNDTKSGQQMGQVQEQPVYDKYAVFRELVEMEQMKEETATKENAESTASIPQTESSDENKDSKSTHSGEEKTQVKDWLANVSDLLSTCDMSVELPPLNQTSSKQEININAATLKDRNETIKEEVAINGRQENKSNARFQQHEADRVQLPDKVQYPKTTREESEQMEDQGREVQSAAKEDDEEEVDEDEEINSISIARDRSSSEEKPTNQSVTTPTEQRQTPKNLAEQDLMKLFTETSSEAISPRKPISGQNDDVKVPANDIFEEIRMLNSAGSQSQAMEENKAAARLQNKMQSGSLMRQEDGTRSVEMLEAERVVLQNKGQHAKSKVTIDEGRRSEEQGRDAPEATAELDEEEADEDEEIDSISNARERSSSEEKPASASVTSPVEQQTAKNLADQDLLKLFSESSAETVSPRKMAATQEEDVRTARTDIFEDIRMLNSAGNQSMASNRNSKETIRTATTSGFEDVRTARTDIFEDIRMLNSAGNQSMASNRKSKENIRTATTSGFEDVFCPFVESKIESKDGQESLADSVKDEGNWAKFENTGVFNSDKSSYDDPASVGGTSPWSPDEKDFQVEGGVGVGRKTTMKQQQPRLHSGESDNEWKDEEESEESNGRRHFRDDGGFWYGRHPRMEMGEESPYYDDPGERVEKDWHFCDRERGGRKFRGRMWSKQMTMHRVRDPSPWHEETPASGRWPRDEEEQQQQQQHSLHRGRYPMSRKQMSASSYKEELDDPSKGYWKCRTKQRAWNGDREGFRNPNQQPPEQQPGHFVGDPIFYEDDRTKKRMMLWSGEREDECDRDRFSSQESMGYDDEERWSRREYERRRGDKWEEEIGTTGSRFWPRRAPGDPADLRSDPRLDSRSEYSGDRAVVPPPSQAPHDLYRKQHYCRADSRDLRERPTGHLYSPSVTGGTGGWIEDDYSLPDRADNSPRYLTRKRHGPKRPNSANDERNMGEPVYADPRVKYGMSRSECSDNDSELYHRPYRSRSRESYWGSDQEFESWTGAGSGSERLYWSEGPDAKSETLHRRRVNRHKSTRPPSSQKSQSSPFEDDFAETLDRTEPSFDSPFAMEASRASLTSMDTNQPTTPRNVKEHLRKADPRSARYAQQPSAGGTRGSNYFENEPIPSETSPGERPRIHSDVKTTPEGFPSELAGGKVVLAANVDGFPSDDGTFFNGDPSPGFDEDAFAFKSEMADSVPETTSAGSLSLKNSRQIKYGNNKIKGDHDIKKSESVNIFVRESDPFDDDDFFK